MVGFGLLVGVLVVSCVVGIASSLFLGHDNPIEEASEQVIFDKTGVDIDLSPGKDPGPH